MRYIDTGARDPARALGTFLSGVLTGATALAELRVQAGFFGGGALGYFDSALRHLAATEGVTRFLVGSNDGETTRTSVEELLAVTGAPRTNLTLGIVSFSSGFFHPKVFHFRRSDGTSTAYVGSANLTPAGVASQHVEAGMLLDTRDGDPVGVLDDIASAIDDWFIDSPPGFYPLVDASDLDPLVAAGVIDVTALRRPVRSIETTTGGHQRGQQPHSLKRLIAIPAVPWIAGASTESVTDGVPIPDTGATAADVFGGTSTNPVEHWGKTLPRSDAQRKATGNQSGAVALTQGDYARQIDQTTYFRHELFGPETWVQETSSTGQPKEVATVPMRVSIDGVDYGWLDFRISNALNRESGQNNYTAQLHLEPISPLFSHTDMTGKKLEIERHTDGTYALRIS